MAAEHSSTKVALYDRLLCLVLITSFNAFCDVEFLGFFPFDHRVLAVKALLEIVWCLALLRISAGALVRDFIDLTLYCLWFKLILLEAYFFNGELYQGIAGTVSLVFNNGIFLASLARLMWGHPKNGNFTPTEWPIIGPYGLAWKRQHGDNAASWAGYFRVIATLLIGMGIAVLLLPITWKIYQYIPSAVGVIIVFLYANPIRQNVVDSEKDLDDQADLLEQYEDVIKGVVGRIASGNGGETGGRAGSNTAGPSEDKPKLHIVKKDDAESE